MKAILVTPKFGGRQYIIGPYSEDEANKKLESLRGKKISVSMDFPKPVSTSEYSLIELQINKI